jgi:hypothetical protein
VEQDSASGHALTISATLLNHLPLSFGVPLGSAQPTWKVPAASIEQLLQLAGNIPLSEDEITPVQAWHMVRQHPDWEKMHIAQVDILKTTLLKEVQCYG